MKKFTAKPIKSNTRKKIRVDDNQQAKEKLEDFYEETKKPLIEKPNNNHGIWALVVLVSILFGFGSSLLYDFMFNPAVEINGNQKVIIEKQEDVTVTSEERLEELTESINPLVINFYNNSDEVSGPFYQDIYSLGSGLILTGDGWIATTQSVMDKIGDKDYRVLTADYKTYEVEKVLEDPLSPVVFVKIEASDLAVAKLASMDKILSGQKVYGFIANYPRVKIASLHLADLQATTLDDVVASTEKLSHFVSAREGYDPSLIGAPIVNLAGEVVAVINDGQSAIPMDYLKTAINDLGKKDRIDRAELGVNYINLAKYPKVDTLSGEMRDVGALLSGFRDVLAVAKNSPADKAGLRVGDIILMIEDEAVNSKRTLTQMIQDYEPGETLKLIVLSNGKEKTVEVELGELE